MASSGMTFVKFIFTLFNLFFLAFSVFMVYVGIAMLLDDLKIAYFEKFLNTNELSTVAYGITGLGVFVFVLSFLGCCGVIRQNAWMLGTFGSIMILIVTIQVVLCILLFIYNKEVENMTYEDTREITKRIVKNYNYTNPNDGFTKMVDEVQKYLRCCGVNGTIDWPYGKVPSSCCEYNTTYLHHPQPNVNLQEQLRVEKNIEYCLNNRIGHYAWKEGCFTKVTSLMSKHVWYLGALGLTFALVQIMSILLSCCIAYSSKKSYHTI